MGAQPDVPALVAKAQSLFASGRLLKNSLKSMELELILKSGDHKSRGNHQQRYEWVMAHLKEKDANSFFRLPPVERRLDEGARGCRST